MMRRLVQFVRDLALVPSIWRHAVSEERERRRYVADTPARLVRQAEARARSEQHRAEVTERRRRERAAREETA